MKKSLKLMLMGVLGSLMLIPCVNAENMYTDGEESGIPPETSTGGPVTGPAAYASQDAKVTVGNVDSSLYGFEISYDNLIFDYTYDETVKDYIWTTNVVTSVYYSSTESNDNYNYDLFEDDSLTNKIKEPIEGETYFAKSRRAVINIKDTSSGGYSIFPKLEYTSNPEYNWVSGKFWGYTSEGLVETPTGILTDYSYGQKYEFEFGLNNINGAERKTPSTDDEIGSITINIYRDSDK